MTSKEALDILNYECIRSNGTDDEFSKELNLIKKDLEVLEIIKKWTFIIQENYKDSYRKFTQFICNIHTIEMNEDFKKVKEWLENDLRRKLQN